MKQPDIASIAASVPTQVDLDRMEADRKARRSNPNPMESLLQNTTNLSKWLERCQAAGISYVPAEFSPDISADEIFNVLDGNGASITLERAGAWLEPRLRSGYMWRWEQCAPMHLKTAIADGVMPQESEDLIIDDPRFLDILFEVNVATTRIAVRPIFPTRRHDGYPIEFRCFASGPLEVAVSNYYPQRPLPESFHAQAHAAGQLALKLYQFTGSPYTADFLLSESGELVFLEGGPPFGAGAHPCCFDPAELRPGAIVLSAQPGALRD